MFVSGIYLCSYEFCSRCKFSYGTSKAYCIVLWDSPRALSFTWWGCWGLCFWHNPTELGHPFLFCSRVCFCLFSSFSCISFHKFSRQLRAFSLCSFGLMSALLVLSAMYLFKKVSISPDIIFYGWLGLKHHLTIVRHWERIRLYLKIWWAVFRLYMTFTVGWMLINKSQSVTTACFYITELRHNTTEKTQKNPNPLWRQSSRTCYP